MHATHRRQYERRRIDVRVQLVIRENHQEQVAPVGGLTIPGRMTNVSGGGARVVVPTYLPRATEVDLEIPVGSELPAGRVWARVMKVQMVDREPRYGLGLYFEDTSCDLVRALRAVEDKGADK
ncbi:MAG: PilZ domain-containing protein [Planctomycetes bacterium]|nr:PilZ domain-containing protein [Planctomycetota bacterium]